MKKYISLLLAVLFLLTACASPQTLTSSEPSEDESIVSEEMSDTSKTTEESPNEDSSSQEEGIEPYEPSTDEPYPEDRKYTLVSVGKPYTSSNAANETYPDLYNQQLTDGNKSSNEGAHYVDTRMVGYTVANSIFIIDLKNDGRRIDRIVARSLVMSIDGVAIAASAEFSGSVDGKSFADIGTLNFENTGENTVSEAVLDINTVTNYRYVRVKINRGYGAFFFTDEIEVYADVEEKEPEDLVELAYKNENIDRNAWKTLSGGKEADPTSSVNIAYGMDYEFKNCSFDSRAPEDATDADTKKLTDGARTNEYFSNPVWIGIIPNEGAEASVNFALPKVYSNIYSFKIYALGSGVGVEYPPYIDIYASKVGKEYTFVGRMYGPVDGDNFVYSLVLPEYIKVKYIRFVFPEGMGSYWMEEIEIFAGYSSEQSDVLYPPVEFPEVTETLLWDATEPDYETEQNLLLGLSQQVSAHFYADTKTHGDESPASFPYLTDGKRADDMYCYSSKWFFTSGGQGIEFFYDIGKLSAINSVNVSLLEQTDWGISRPKYISVFLSEDGDNWYEVVDWSRGDVQLNAPATRVEIPLEFDNTYAARFVRFRFEGAAMFFDEFEAFGTKKVDSSAVKLSESGITPVPFYTKTETQQFADSQNTPITNDDIVFVYGDRNKPEDLLPMVAYLDEDGNIKDTLMNGFIYCTHFKLPSGSQAHLPNYKIDWEYSFDQNFNGPINFGILDETVGKVKEALGLTDYKVQVYVSFLTLHDTVTDFGDVDGDGISEDATTVEGRQKIFDWYIKLNMDEFQSRGYENLELNGFYWVNEAVIWEHDDSHVITECGERVHAAGSNFIWVPYFQANRFFTGYELGFDAIAMQPNVVFSTDAPYWRFDAAVTHTKTRKMAIEIEHSYQCLGDTDFARSYMLYLYYGAVTGYMNAINIHYDDVANYALLGYSDSKLCRLQYDALYQYSKGTLNVTPEKAEDIKLEGKKDNSVSGNLNTNDDIAFYTLVDSPENGYISFSSDGSFRYFPDKGFSGTDSFTYTYNNLLGESEICTVEMTIS